MINRPNLHLVALALALSEPARAQKDKPRDSSDMAPRVNTADVQDELDARFVATIQPCRPIA